MKKVLVAALCCGLAVFSNIDSAEAAEQKITNIEQSAEIQMQELGKWSHFRDKYIYGDPHRGDRRDGYRPPPPPPPPPPRRGSGPRRPYPPPPPPHHRH